MKCLDCKFYHGGNMYNRCDLTESEYFKGFWDKPCTLIDDNYIILEDCPPLGLKKGEMAKIDTQ